MDRFEDKYHSWVYIKLKTAYGYFCPVVTIFLLAALFGIEDPLAYCLNMGDMIALKLKHLDLPLIVVCSIGNDTLFPDYVR